MTANNSLDNSSSSSPFNSTALSNVSQAFPSQQNTQEATTDWTRKFLLPPPTRSLEATV